MWSTKQTNENRTTFEANVRFYLEGKTQDTEWNSFLNSTKWLVRICMSCDVYSKWSCVKKKQQQTPGFFFHHYTHTTHASPDFSFASSICAWSKVSSRSEDVRYSMLLTRSPLQRCRPAQDATRHSRAGKIAGREAARGCWSHTPDAEESWDDHWMPITTKRRRLVARACKDRPAMGYAQRPLANSPPPQKKTYRPQMKILYDFDMIMIK